jgi:hypothetical protein
MTIGSQELSGFWNRSLYRILTISITILADLAIRNRKEGLLSLAHWPSKAVAAQT